MNKNYTYVEKHAGDSLTHTEWNNLALDVDAVVNNSIVSETNSTETGDDPKSTIVFDSKISGIPQNVAAFELTYKDGKGTNVSVVGDNNITIEPRIALGTGKGKNKASDLNRKGGHISLKPGDDIELWGHHRGSGKNTEVMLKAMTETGGSKAVEVPADLLFNVNNIMITNKDKCNVIKVTPESNYSDTPDISITSTAFSDITEPTLLDSSEYAMYATAQTAGEFTVTEVGRINALALNKSLVYAITNDGLTKYYTITKVSLPDNILNVKLESETLDNNYAYLKLRAQAIDLRCEEHGGIALQPKGNDGDGNENKIKFEHGGGDGLEFGTFNTKKTSIFTDEYRFNKTGVWKMASRFTEPSDKADLSDSTTANKYLKNNAVNNSAKALATGKTFESADDFYDFVDVTDIQCTTLDIIKTASAMNSHGASTTNNGNLDIECTDGGIFVPISTTSTTILEFTIADSNVALAIEFPAVGEYAKGSEIAEVFSAFEDQETVIDTINAASNDDVIEIRINDTPKCKFKVCNGNITLNSTYGKLKFRGELDFGKSFNFGETENGILIQKKYTKKGSEKSCDILKVYAINNNASPHNFNSIWDNSLNLYVAEQSVSVASGASQIIAQCSMYDIIKAVCWMKANNQGPWASLS